MDRRDHRKKSRIARKAGCNRFRPPQEFLACAGERYSLLPFRFIALDRSRYLLTNFAGEYVVMPRHVLHSLVRHRLPLGSDAYNTLKSRHFVLDGDSSVAIDLLAAKYRTKQSFLAQFTSLFMFVTTLRCDHACVYCQASRRAEDAPDCDMSPEVADRAVEFMFRSPSPAIKVEFQGGESLLNFPIVKRIVRAVEDRNQSECRDVAFVLTTNLSALNDDTLRFCREHGVHISTSLDGPRDLHNRNRPRSRSDSYDEAVRGIRRAREELGPDRVSALMTTTRASLSCAREIVDEYISQGLSSIFLRPLNPYGKAAALRPAEGYTTEEWLEFFREALRHIVEQAHHGLKLREEFSALLLRKMLTPYSTSHVDLQSPAGIGIGAIVFNYDGCVYPSDEARMLAEMGDPTFYMGQLLTDSYEDVMLSGAVLTPLSETLSECVPQCADCGLQPYCGSDPVRHYRLQGDPVGFKPTSGFCKTHKGAILHLVTLLEDDRVAAEVLRTWM